MSRRITNVKSNIMTKVKQILFWLGFAIVLVGLYLLLSGSPVLVYTMFSNPLVPVGTAVAWGLVILTPMLTGYNLGLKRFRYKWIGWIFIFLNRVSFLLGLAFGWIGYLWSGNWAFNFGPEVDGTMFWNLVRLIIVLNLLTLFFRFIFLMFIRPERKAKVSTT